MNIDKLREAWQLGNPKVFRFKSILGIVAFGDYCDMPSKDKFGKAYQVWPLTDDENGLIRFITQAQKAAALARGGEVRKMVLLV